MHTPLCWSWSYGGRGRGLRRLMQVFDRATVLAGSDHYASLPVLALQRSGGPTGRARGAVSFSLPLNP